MGRKLSILDRTHSETGWHKSKQFDASEISQIKLSNAGNDKSLNAIPSPFARIYLTHAALELVDKDETNNTNIAGEAYQRLVSDMLDVFELLYNWNNHLKAGMNLEMKTWKKEESIEELNSGNEMHKLLGDAFKIFLDNETFKDIQDINLLVCNGHIISGTSPFTGFFVNYREVLEQTNIHNPVSKRNYFSKIIPFKDRDPRVQKFVSEFISQISQRSENLKEATRTFREYLQKYQRSFQGADLEVEDLQVSPSSVFGFNFKSSSRPTDLMYFEDYLVKINYRMNDECFQTLKIENDRDDRNYDYLLPLTDQFFKDYEISDIGTKITAIEEVTGTVRVVLSDGATRYERVYRINLLSPGPDGKIIDAASDNHVKFNIGIFPFLKVTSANGEAIPYNDFYKIFYAIENSSKTYNNNDFDLSLRIREQYFSVPTDNNFRINVSDRTVIGENSVEGTRIFTVEGQDSEDVSFDVIKLSLPFITGKKVNAKIVPKWNECTMGDKRVDFAIDFGTSSTFISYTDDMNYASRPKALSLANLNGVRSIATQFLNKPKRPAPGETEEHSFRLSAKGVFDRFIEFQNREFIPSLLNSKEFAFPFRTAVYAKQGIRTHDRKLFSDTNIGFSYQKITQAASTTGQEFVPNLKWNIDRDDDYKKYVELFLEEVLHLTRFKCLILNGDPGKSRVTWFAPLSFTSTNMRKYSEIWESHFRRIMKGDPVSNLRNITESEAPFYYHSKQAIIPQAQRVLTIDIGGGTADIMYIKDSVPKFCSSVHFGANVLWGNGFNEFRDIKDNGIFVEIKEKLKNILDSTSLNLLNDEYCREGAGYSSDEIINFWIYNNDLSHVLEYIDSPKFKLLYLLHFSSLIYHVLKLAKHKLPGEDPPQSIIFSGNGSKYLNLLHSRDFLKKICDYLANKVFSGTNASLNLILPQTELKESSCYGALYFPFEKPSEYEKINFLGFEETNGSAKLYSDIESNKEHYFNSVYRAFEEFLDIFFDMDLHPGLSFVNEFEIRRDLSLLRKYMKERGPDFLENGYQSRTRNIVNNNEEITDSLFFYPVVGLIHEIGKSSDDEIRNKARMVTKYSGAYREDVGFTFESLKDNAIETSVFKLTYLNNDSHDASYTVIDNFNNQNRAIKSHDTLLKDGCEYENGKYPSAIAEGIEVLKTGKLVRTDTGWKIREKALIRFLEGNGGGM